MDRPATFRSTSLLALFLLLAVPAVGQGWEWPDRAENLEVLPEDTPPQQLRATMIAFVRGLGVRCEHCHDDSAGSRLSEMDFAADTKEAKETARLMMRMVQRINGDDLAALDRPPADRVRVTCMTCHRGYQKPVPLDDLLAGAIEEEGVEAAVERYHALHERYGDGYAFDFRPGTLNALGYRLLGEGRTDEALTIFHLNAEMHPDDANVYDSLGEAYLAKGEAERAEALYLRALALDPSNQNAVQKLREIRGAGD
ncbi:MAG: c-type cytochrome [Rhodothermales bacterium]|nr:c-type cytochrome [Rhodothermales bacterium]